MEKMSHSNSRRMYSWWWDSHISPKNSKWLQENLTDMDSKVKVMIKLIEEDADSFARRAEAYYKKRPELMKMVEEFYRAYRALAERYDHATGVIRHAHHTMTEAQVPMMFSDDSPSGSEPRTPNGEFTDEYDSSARRKGLKQLNGSFGLVDRVRKGLNFDEAEEKEETIKSKENNLVEDRKLSKSDEVSESEDIRKLKESIAKLEAEKEAGLALYQESLDKLSQLEAEISQTKEDYRVFTDRASKAENEVFVLKESLAKFETEKETKIQEYQKSLERISDLQNILSTAEEDAKKLDKRASSAEIEVQTLKGEICKLAVEKDESLNKYMKSLEMISNLETKLRLAEEDTRGLKERAENAENEVELLNQTISKLTKENHDLSLQHQKCLEMISVLENKLRISEEEAKRLNAEVNNGVSKLKGAEEQCLLLKRSNQSLHSELESLMLKMGTQTQELTEKQKELGRLWACVQEERLRFVEAETAFQTLQHLHAQTQDELRSMASELNKRAQLLKVVETRHESLQDEVLKVKEENEISASSIKNMQNEISGLKESKGTLEKEVELRIDQRNALQQEIYCLKEELNNINTKHVSILDQVRAVGMNSDSLGSSVKELQDENSKLKETCHKESSERAVLLGKMVIMEQLIEKNSILENSLSDLNAELEAVRGKIETLEHSCQSLLEEKSTILDEKDTLVIQLEKTNKDLQKLSENNTVLENSLSDAHHQFEALKAKSKFLEDSCHLLVNEKAGLISEKDGLISELENTRTRLEDLGKIYGELEGRCLILEKEKESTLQKVEELQMSLEVEREELASCIQVSEKRELEMSFLHEERQLRKKELDQVIDNSIENEIEIFVLRRTAQQLAKSNCSILIKNQKLLEEFNSSEKKIKQLKNNNFEQILEIKSLSEQAGSLREGTSELLKVLDIIEDHVSMDKIEQDNVYFNHLLTSVKNMKESICNAEEENQQRDVELSVVITFIRQLQSEVLTVLDMNKALDSKLRVENSNSKALLAQNEHLNRKLIDTEGTCRVLEREKFEISVEKQSLMDSFLLLEKKNTVLEEDNYVLYDEVLALDNLSLFFRSYADEKFIKLRELGDNFDKLQDSNIALTGKLSLTEGDLEDSKTENFNLQERLQKSQDELKELGDNLEKLQDLNVALVGKLSLTEGDLENSKIENFHLQERLQKSHDELKELSNNFEKLQDSNVALVGKLSLAEENFEDSKTENFHLQERSQKSQDELKELGDNFEKLQDLNVALVGKLSLVEGNFKHSKAENFHLRERSQKSQDELKELGDNFEKLQDLNVALMGKLSLTEGKLEESKTENFHLQERLQKSLGELNDVAAIKDQLSNEIEDGKKMLHHMELELNQLNDEHNKRKVQEENLQLELQSKMDEIVELETEAASVFGRFQFSMISQLLYEQKFHELHNASLGYLEENGDLKTQLAAYGPEVLALKECISSLEDHTDIHIKFQNPEFEEMQDAQTTNYPPGSILNGNNRALTPSTFSDFCNLRERLQAIQKAAVEIKELMVQENVDLRSKLDASTRQLELLQSESARHTRNLRPTSEIIEADNATKDIMLDQVSDGSSYGYSKRESVPLDNQIVELWETEDPDGAIGITIGKSKKIATSPSAVKKSDLERVKSVKKQKGEHRTSGSLSEKDLSLDKLEISKRFTEPLPEGDKRKVLERLDSDIQKLANLQITVQDLKRKLVVTEKDKRGKAVIECEALKGQLEEADLAIMKLFDLNGKLTKSIDDSKYFPEGKSSFDLEGDGGARRRRASEQARRMSEKIGRLQLEVQKLQFVLLKLDDNKEGKAKASETKRRVLLRDYLYGGGRKGQRHKKTQFCACVQPSTVED